MKTTKTVKIETNIENIVLGIWDDEKEEFFSFDEMEREKVLVILSINEKFLETLEMFVGDLKDNLMTDLKDIWKRLDNAGI